MIKNGDSRWFVSDQEFGDTLVSDHKLRTFLKKKEQQAGVPKIEIERAGDMVRIYIHCAKPGMIIGRQGTEIDKLKAECEKMLGKTVSINVVEIKQPDLDAQLVAENIASQLEKRISFRRAMKQSIGRTMRLGAKGIKVAVSGRLGGAEIARSEHYHEGTIPLQTIRADIDYGFWEANTTYGKIGVKVWIYKGEVLAESTEKTGEDRRQRRRFNNDNRGDRRDRRDRRDGGRREGGRHDGARREGGRPNPYSNYNGPRGPRAPREGGNK